MKSIVMYVYSDLRTDARVMRAATALMNEFKVTLLASNTDTSGKNIPELIEFINVIDTKIENPLVRYIKSLQAALKIIKEKKPDIVYCHDYYAAPLVAFRFGQPKTIKYVYDAHELYIANSESSKREKIVNKIEKKAINTADIVICASERRKEIMSSIYRPIHEIACIPNISILPTNSKSLILNSMKDFFSDKRIAVVYCGAIIKARRIDKIVKAVGERSKHLKLLIIGSGEDKKSIQQLIKDDSYDNIYMIESVPYREIYSIISKCDIGYLYYENDTMNNKYCAPNKIYEYASAGLVMVANDNLGLLDIIEKYNIGIADADIGKALDRVYVDIGAFRNNLEHFLMDNSWEKQEVILKEAIKTL